MTGTVLTHDDDGPPSVSMSGHHVVVYPTADHRLSAVHDDLPAAVEHHVAILEALLDLPAALPGRDELQERVDRAFWLRGERMDDWGDHCPDDSRPDDPTDDGLTEAHARADADDQRAAS